MNDSRPIEINPRSETETPPGVKDRYEIILPLIGMPRADTDCCDVDDCDDGHGDCDTIG